MNGDDEDPIYTFLKSSISSKFFYKKIAWNYTKFLVDKEGNPYKRYEPNIDPKDMEDDIKELLK